MMRFALLMALCAAAVVPDTRPPVSFEPARDPDPEPLATPPGWYSQPLVPRRPNQRKVRKSRRRRGC